MKKKSNYITIGRSSLGIVRNYFPKVTTVRDARRPVIVDVTQNDNKIANIKSHRTCAMAVACKRAFKADGVLIGLTTSYIIIGKVAHRYKHADTVSREITSFDRRAGFDIGRYQLSPPSPSNRLGARVPINPDRPSGKHTKNKRFMHFTTGVRTALGSGDPEVA